MVEMKVEFGLHVQARVEPMIGVSCPKCLKSFDVPETASGKTATCPCGHRFRLPDVTPEVEFETAEPAVFVPDQKPPKKSVPVAKIGLGLAAFLFKLVAALAILFVMAGAIFVFGWMGAIVSGVVILFLLLVEIINKLTEIAGLLRERAEEN
jgi:hypothetical protein